jgi:hypothetical protein
VTTNHSSEKSARLSSASPFGVFPRVVYCRVADRALDTLNGAFEAILQYLEEVLSPGGQGDGPLALAALRALARCDFSACLAIDAVSYSSASMPLYPCIESEWDSVNIHATMPCRSELPSKCKPTHMHTNQHGLLPCLQLLGGCAASAFGARPQAAAGASWRARRRGQQRRSRRFLLPATPAVAGVSG